MENIIKNEHYTLILGDALDVLPTIKDVDLCVSDPPYLLESGGQCGNPEDPRTMKGMFAAEHYNNSGHLFDGNCPEWKDFCPLIFNCLAEQAHCYLMAESKNQFEMQVQARAAGFRFHNLLYWDKGSCTPNRWYMKGAEFVGFFYKGKAFNINNCSSQQGIYIRQIDVTSHPTEKPVLLMQHYITNSSKKGQTVIDPFMGSGTTGIAAIRSGRKFIGIERDPHWFGVAQARLDDEIRGINKQTIDLFE